MDHYEEYSIVSSMMCLYFLHFLAGGEVDELFAETGTQPAITVREGSYLEASKWLYLVKDRHRQLLIQRDVRSKFNLHDTGAPECSHVMKNFVPNQGTASIID